MSPTLRCVHGRPGKKHELSCALATVLGALALGCASDDARAGADDDTSAATDGGTSADGDGPGGGPGDGPADGPPGDGPATCGNGAVDAGEACDGNNLAGLSCEVLGFVGGTLSCASDCTTDVGDCISQPCGNGELDDGEQCDPEGTLAATCADVGFASGPLACRADCQYDTSACEACGNGTVDFGEECDGPDLGGLSCETRGFEGGAVTCRDDCTIDDSGCSTCGDNSVGSNEACDNANLGGETCASLGFLGGTLSCSTTCDALVTDDCITCGNGLLDDGEACEGGDLGGSTCASLGLGGGTLVCNEGCGFDVAQCDLPGVPFGSDGVYEGFAFVNTTTPCDSIIDTGEELVDGFGGTLQVVDIPFDFPYYGQSYDAVTVSNRGAVRLGTSSPPGNANTCLPGLADRQISVYWGASNNLGDIFVQSLGEAPNRRFVVEWEMTDIVMGVLDIDRYQAVLHESGDIDACYVDTTSIIEPFSAGAVATAGLQGELGVALEYSCNEAELVEGLHLAYRPL